MVASSNCVTIKPIHDSHGFFRGARKHIAKKKNEIEPETIDVSANDLAVFGFTGLVFQTHSGVPYSD
jgi:hypothetical protein